MMGQVMERDGEFERFKGQVRGNAELEIKVIFHHESISQLATAQSTQSVVQVHHYRNRARLIGWDRPTVYGYVEMIVR